MTLVKVCGITNLEDALAALAAGADMLGFNFYARSPRYVETAVAWRVIEHLPEGVECVGVFVNESSPEDVLEIARESGVSAVQLHGDETPEFCRALEGFTTIKALRVGRDYAVEKAAAFDTDAVLLDAFAPDAFGGTGHTFDWALARATREAVPRLFLAGGLKPSNVAAAIDAVGPHAVDVCSGVETSPGRKSFQLMRDFVAAARKAGRMKDEGIADRK
ncbi:MAG TPA: phosphoribosylanthranilate isomerase [Pyrinomonadaceae bacterium]|jgi:phosphoribosylanthranilate isomerase|nr:phosphoribosylanthranilate isomerase [Pyrinomonadaceae bacterium]